MIFFKSFITKGRISKQLSPGDPSYMVGGLGGQPGGSAQGVSPGGQPRVKGQPGGSAEGSLCGVTGDGQA